MTSAEGMDASATVGIPPAVTEETEAFWNAAREGRLLVEHCTSCGADQFPPLAASFDESAPCQTNLLGVKGVGELGTIGATPAAVHAVLDALAARGIEHLEMPLTAERVWRALRGV